MLGAHRKEGQEKVQGLALNPSFLANDDFWEVYLPTQIYIESKTKRDPHDEVGYKYMWSPCHNYKHLIIHVDIGLLNNFRPDETPPMDAELDEGDGSEGSTNGHKRW
ncbi:hypothetical protein FOCG_15088 [Fusarium oxysporum f. sp. radicis-lycopersici 26381]|uniref:Uncharacterized protein n=4 Tax=Fusarium oxysporum TaxID=5507 RepID=A0A2H3G889_FUSOX|nr:hypothetical protein FOCG_15088 [Fusarium oxysporum f. sp. radicis-lycopersici 26381]PCD23304.1 hypothetical protein AU210_014827 [Fusarium oxysporum f. sp. radicis-cucumerinum]RKK09741.1 hypothetical protein BFJ65_g16186 [Fusarium oxysporum f. sp. cepae]RKK92209.1 hypothetical protein BFJ71_g10295 [Fusarium oxysporum]RYC79978.1 hypothetical protein BFJ63_vAg17140 [Fusarium oxysporum f. sp. narcissi]